MAEEEGHIARLVAKKEEAEGIATFSFLPEKKIEFKAGQIAFFEFEFEGKQYKKHFTISSSPERKKIEFSTIISDSEYKQALNKLPIEHPVKISDPMGNFTLDARKSEKIAFLAGGIGITPVRSVMEFFEDKGRIKGLETVIFYSNRNQQRIAFKQELEEIAAKIGNIQIVHTLTDLTEQEKGKWQGETTFIDRQMIKRYLVNEQDYFFYVAGPASFNEAMRKILLQELGIPEEMVLIETFTGY